jgi:uncharacterized membrane protein
MTEVLAVAFDDPQAASEVLTELRALGADHLIELEDACIAVRSQEDGLHLTQAIGHSLADALHGQFWLELVHHILHHGGPETRANHCRLDRRFCCDVADALTPGSSALFVLVRQSSADALVGTLEKHHGRILRSTLPEHEQEALEVAVGMRPPAPPSAAELQAMIEHEAEDEARAAQQKRDAAAARRRQEIDQLRQGGLTPDDIRAIVQRCTDAARAGQGSTLAYRFPGEVCLDGGRAINNGEPGWPATLVGKPRAVYEYWQKVLHPAGYHIKATILSFPAGVPGDAGLFLSWMR